MPSLEAHLAAVEENLDAYEQLPDSLPGWKAVVLFYAAVHVVEALFATQNVHHREHMQRETYIKQHHKSIWPAYSRLKEESLKARYLAMGYAAGTGNVRKSQFSMTSPQVHEQLRKKCLVKIKAYVDTELEAARLKADDDAV